VLKVQGGEKTNRDILPKRKPINIVVGAFILLLGVFNYQTNNLVGGVVALIGIAIVVDGLGFIR
jgi:hypothetical protein